MNTKNVRTIASADIPFTAVPLALDLRAGPRWHRDTVAGSPLRSGLRLASYPVRVDCGSQRVTRIAELESVPTRVACRSGVSSFASQGDSNC